MSVKNLSFPLLAFIAGVAVASYFSPSDLLLPLALLLGSLAGLFISRLLCGPFFSDSSISVFTLTLLLIACFLSLLLGIIRTEQEISLRSPEQANEFTGRVVSEPMVRPRSVRYQLTTDKLPLNVLITTSRDRRFNYGDKLRVRGDISRPGGINGFDYESFLLKENISHTAYYPQIEKLESDPHPFYSRLYSAKDHMREQLRDHIPHPHYTIIGAMTLGDSQLVPPDLGDKFGLSGIRHIIAVSGTHISIIMGMILALLHAVPRMTTKRAWLPAVSFLVLYVLLVGAPASAIRSAVMGGISLLALAGGRSHAAQRALLLAAVFMLLYNPLLLRFDIGFQLSFAALLGIIYISPFIHHLLQPWADRLCRGSSSVHSFNNFITNKIGIEQPNYLVLSLIAVSLGAELAVSPLVAYHFGYFSLVGPLTNLLVMPLIPLLLAASFVFLFISWLPPIISTVLSLPIYLLTEYIMIVSKFLVNLPASHFYIEELHILWPATVYALGTVFMIRLSRTETGRRVLHKRLI